MFSVEVDGPFVCGPGLETANKDVGMVFFRMAVRHESARRVRAEIEATDLLRGPSSSIAIAEVNRITRVEPVVALDRVLDLPVINTCQNVTVTETDRVGSGAASKREEVAEKRRAIDLERLNFGCIRDD